MRAAVAALGLLCYVFAPITTHALRLGGLDGDEEGAIGVRWRSPQLADPADLP